MMDVREFVKKRIVEKGLNMRGVSLQIKRNAAYIQQFVEKHVPQKLPEDVREALAPILDVNPDQLRNGKISQVIAHPLARRPVVRAQPGDKVPVMGIAEGGPEGYSLWNGEVVAYVDRPPSLLDTPRGYAVYAVGSSMEPRYYAGETLYINPIKPPKPSDFVLIQLKPKSEGDQPPALIKRLVRRTATKLVVEQYNPAKTYDIPIADVLEIHKIVGSGE